MHVVEIRPELFFVERGYLSANHLVFRGARPVLIDSGFIGEWSTTERTIRSLGVHPREVSLIIATHTHCDHVGGNRALQAASACAVALHPLGRRFAEAGNSRAMWHGYFDQPSAPFAATRSLADGETIALGSYRFQVIHTPGHAPDGIALYDAEAKVLISSDALWERDLPALALRLTGPDTLDQVEASLDKLERLDAQLVLPGHGLPFTDLRGAIAKSRRKLADYRRDQSLIGRDLLKKLIIFALLAHGPLDERAFTTRITSATWFHDAIADHHLGNEPAQIFHDLLDQFIARGTVRRVGEQLKATVKP